MSTIINHKLLVVVQVIFMLVWMESALAFSFCFSSGGGSNNRHRYYSGPPPFARFAAIGYPVFPSSPVRTDPEVRPYLYPETPVPATTGYMIEQNQMVPETELPAPTGSSIRRQHIFE